MASEYDKGTKRIAKVFVVDDSSNKLDCQSTTQKICGVCGDKALGYNFSAISCESCKAFFRRNALLSREFKCAFSEQCEINVLTRKFCQKCRLEKCFSIGMVKEHIMTEEDKKQKREKIERNRAKKRLKQRLRDDEVSSSRAIKREDNDNSEESWSQHANIQLSPSSIDSYNSGNNASLSVQYEILHSTSGSPMTVIMHQNLSDNDVEEFALNAGQLSQSGDVAPFQIQNPTSVSVIEPSIPLETGANNSFENCLLNGSSNDVSRDSRLANLDNDFSIVEKDESTVIRSMLTATPNAGVYIHTTTTTTDDAQFSQMPGCDDGSQLHEQPKKNEKDKADITRDILEDVERIPIEPNSIESILCEAIKLEFEAYSSIPQSSNTNRGLNDAERAKLNELIVANKALSAPLDDDMSNLLTNDSRFKPTQSKHDPALLGIINLTAIAIRRLIKMAKKINAFKNMCEEDQVALLKGGCTEMMILRSTMTYDCARDTWKIPHSQEELSNIKADVLKLAKGNIYQEHDRFIRTFDPRWRLDENIVLIMSAILLFTPDRPKVVHSDVIKLEQNSYYYLLRRYLESVYPGCEAKSTFLKLIQKIMELHKLADEVIGVYLDVNPIEPLLIEIFDLKQH